MSLIREGYKIPFIEIPTPKISSNNSSALKEKKFASEAITELLNNKCIEQLDSVTNIVNPLSVSIQSSGKKRLILDLRHVNSFVFKQKFKCEDLKIALSIFSEGYFIHGYHHVEVFPEHIQEISLICLGFWRWRCKVLLVFSFGV